MDLIPVESVSSYDTRQWKYDVFVSFCGEDTLVSFADHLYVALKQKGISNFKKDEKLQMGSAILPALHKAIEESRISVIIFSRRYASSSWCLNELVEILKCREEKGQIVLPVFYHVHPSDVRHQKGSFEEAFAMHEERFKENLELVQTWRSALTEVARLSGWNLQDGHESKVIKQIVKAILDTLATRYLNSTELLVGMDSRVEEIFSYLGIGLTDVRMVGICGIGGVGKSTIARVAYERLFGQFEASCFLANIGEVAQKFGLICLQEILLSTILKERVTRINGVLEGVKQIRNRLHRKRILLVLDDVDQSEQLNILAGERDFFGLGSRIIITSRDKHLLHRHNVDQIYEPKKLSNEEALELFSLKSFNRKHPPKDYVEMSNLFVNYIGGLPLALKVIGSSLYQKTNKEWKSALGKILLYPERKILDVLEISFDGLDYMEKEIFLHIACFFEGMDKDHVIEILGYLGFYVDYGLQILIEKSLLEVSLENRLCMHYLIQQMGREIVRQECVKEPGRRSRLWMHEDIDHVLRNNTGTEAIGGIILELPLKKEVQGDPEAFSKMSNLKLLKIGNMHLPNGLAYLPRALRFLDWSHYPLKSLPATFQPDQLVELNMCHSKIELLWETVKYLDNLKFIKLSHSQNLRSTPNFTGIPNLQILDLEGCTNLIEVHPSVGVLKRLTLLNLKDCIRLTRLPSKIETESLEILILSGCSKIKKISNFGENVQQLQKLYLNGTAIKKLPSSILHLTGLNLLDLRGCKSLAEIGVLLDTPVGLHFIPVVPPSIIKLLWVGVKFLNNLTIIDLSYSQHLVQIPDFTGIPNLEELYLEGCTNLIEVHPSVGVLKRLTLLNLKDSIRLRSLPSMIERESLEVLILAGCTKIKKISNFGDIMRQLQNLYLSWTAIKELPMSILHLTGLNFLDLSGCKSLEEDLHTKIGGFLDTPVVPPPVGLHFIPVVPPSIIKLLWMGVKFLNNLTIIDLSYSRNLVQIPDFTGIPNLEELYLEGCTNLIEVHSSVAVLKRLLCMNLSDCICLRSLPSKIETESLRILILSGCSNVKVIPDFAENMEQLCELYLNGTAIKTLPSSIEHLTGLIVLDLSHCKNLLYLPRTIIRLEYLREFVVSGCSKLAKFEDCETASTHEPEIELISSKTLVSSHAHEMKDVEISSGAETESAFSQIKGESQLSKLTMHVKEPIEPPTPLAVSTSGTNKGATVEPFLSESSKLSELPDPETKPISLEKPELLSAHGTKVMEKRGKMSIPETVIQIVPSQPTEEGTSKQAAVEPMSVSHVMGADKEVQMEGLLPEEAWKLFWEQVGGIIESPNIQQFARAIVQKCHGFPLLIIVTGRALAKENDALAWMHASKEFSQCSAHWIYGYEALIQKLKFSYDRLEGPDVKRCFLYCALFPDDQEISIDELVDYWIQEGLVAGNQPDSYKRGRDIVDILVGASLLQSVQVGISIKMHYLIRDLASRILSLEVEGCQFLCGSYSKMTQLSHMGNRLPILEYHRFLSRAGAGLIELPLKEEWEEAKMIFLMDNELTSLPERPNCPRLLALFLQRNHNLRVIPTSFFDLMPSLTILNLSKTRIKFLPKSICKLTMLEVLILRHCERLVQLPSEVGSLRRLVVLDLQGTKLNKLSNEISELASLRHLKVSFYGSVNQSEYDNLPPELLSHVVIRNLSELETLSIDVYPGDMRWNENVKSVIDEVSNLTNLTTFCCYFPKVEFLELFLRTSATWKIGGLTEFKFVVGHDVKRFASQNVDNLELDYVQWGQCLRFVNGEVIPNAVLEVLTRTTAFCLDHHINVLSLSEFGLGNFNGLRLCVVRECPEIQEIVADAELSDAVFPILEHLTINSLPDLRKICKEMIPQGSFAELRVLTVYTCPNLEFVFASSMLQSFSNLEELIVEDCSAIKKIVESDGGTLPSLKRLKLHSLPNLVNIMKGAWPPLENISFYDCPMLKKLDIDSNLIQTIKEIKAEEDWWEELEWQDSSLYSRLQARFTAISEEDL